MECPDSTNITTSSIKWWSFFIDPKFLVILLFTICSLILILRLFKSLTKRIDEKLNKLFVEVGNQNKSLKDSIEILAKKDGLIKSELETVVLTVIDSLKIAKQSINENPHITKPIEISNNINLIFTDNLTIGAIINSRAQGSFQLENCGQEWKVTISESGKTRTGFTSRTLGLIDGSPQLQEGEHYIFKQTPGILKIDSDMRLVEITRKIRIE